MTRRPPDPGQLDLFGPTLVQPDHADALACLRDAMSDALTIVLHLANPSPRNSHTVRASGDWAFSVTDKGLRHERAATWWPRNGWDGKPKNLLPWADLADLIGGDPRRTQIQAWAGTLPWPNWKPLSRPFELWPNPGSWHPSYIAGDRADVGWPARRHAWQLVLDLLDDAAAGRAA